MRSKLLTSFFAICIVASYGFAQELDVTPYLVAIIKCNAEKYDPSQSPFNSYEFNEAWTACKPSREALLSTLPEEMHPEWEAKLENVRRSLIDQFQPQPSEEGYGLNPETPVEIGGVADGPSRTYAYFSRLGTTDGHSVTVKRLGSCCRFKTPNASVGIHGLLDKYELTVEGSPLLLIVYVNIYDEGNVLPVEGFILRDET